jgi:hypothetical protein
MPANAGTPNGSGSSFSLRLNSCIQLQLQLIPPSEAWEKREDVTNFCIAL